MGKTRNTGKLATQIQFDNSNNLVIGTSASSSFNTSGSVNAIGGITGSIFGIGDPTSFSASISSDLINLENKSASVDTIISNINSKTGSYATTGSNSFYGTQVFSGSVYIANDLIVQGSSSIQYISASSVSIGTNIVQLNTATPSVRYAGVSVQDSGSSAGVTGSILWDSLCNRWIYSNPSTIGYSGGMLMSGPRTSTLGTESPLTCNYIAKSGGGDHLYDSCIIDDGTTTCIKNNLIGTGTICAPIGTFTNSAGVPSVNVRASDSNFSLLSVLGNQTGDVNWLLMSGYPNAGDFTIRQSDVVNALTINKTNGISCFAGIVCVPQLIVSKAGGTSYNIANYLNTNSTTNSQTYFFHSF
jgi:hypothetical protein